MADLDLDPLLRDLARDASRRARLAEAATVRHSGDQRRLAKGIGVGAGVVLLTTGTFGLMTRGMGASINAAQTSSATGATASSLPTHDPSLQPSPTEAFSPTSPAWAPRPSDLPTMTAVTQTAPSTTNGATGTTGSSSPASNGSSSSAGPSQPPRATGSTAPPVTSGPPTSRPSAPTSGTPSSPATSAPTTTPSSPGSPSAPPTSAPPSLSTYTMYLNDAVGGAGIGERVGTAAGFGGPSGTLPYAPRVATTAVITGSDAAAKPVTVAVGVGRDGVAHLTYFTDGTMTGDSRLAANLNDTNGLVALYQQKSQHVTVLAFHASGTVTRFDISSATTTPKVSTPRAVARANASFSAATLGAHFDNDGAGSVTAYAVSGDRLMLVTAPATGMGSATTLVAKGLSGTTVLARLATGGVGAGGVAAWTSQGTGGLYYGANAFKTLTYVGQAPPLPR